MRAKIKFSQRHPLLFGFAMIMMAVVLLVGASAFFSGSASVDPDADRVGIVYLDGMIFEAGPVVDFIAELRDDETVKGIILRVNSPGGAIAPSQELYQAVKRLNEVKPVVASYDSVAASGGYYASCPAEEIVANPGSVTGSIGVLIEYLDVSQLAEKFGVRLELMATGEQKGAGSPMRELTPAQREVFQAMLMDMHDQFVSDVAISRGMKKNAVQVLADGRAYTGRQARDRGLVDTLGTFDDAIDILMDYCQLDTIDEFVEGPVEEVPLIDELLGQGRLERLVRSGPAGAVSGPRFLYK